MSAPEPIPAPKPLPDQPWYVIPWPTVIKATWAATVTVVLAITSVHCRGCADPKPVPDPTPIPQADIRLPKEIKAQPGRQTLITADTKGAIVHWWVPEPCDVSYHPDVPKASVSGPIGSFPVLAWTSVDGKPTPAAIATLVIGDVPPVPPGPSPVPPGPPPSPAPIQDKGLRVLMVYRALDLPKYPKEQAAALSDTTIRAWLDTNCVKVNGTPERRFFEPDENLTGESDLWKKAMQRERKDLPWLIVSNGVTGYEGPLPPNRTEILNTLQKYVEGK